VVGFSTVGAQSDSHGFVYRDGTMTDLGTLGGSSSSAGFISNTDTIVGSSKTADGSDRAVIYSDGRVTDLNSLIDPSDPLATKGFVAATKINEDGVITVIADRNTTNPQRFLLGIELADVPFCIPEIDLSFKVVDVSSLHEQNI